MTLSFPSPEFDDTVAGVCHGVTTEAAMRALNELLRRDPGARDEYLLRVEVHARLASEPDLFAPPANSADSCRLPEIDLRRGRNLPSPDSNPPVSQRKPVRALALTACLILVTAGVWGWWLKRGMTREGTTSNAVAMLARAVDARWAGTSPTLRTGSALAPGRLRLESGLAQLVFYSGARVVIEGPTELQLVSPAEVVCPAGRLLAEVPQLARGFRVKTAQLNVVDLGTAFGIDATGSQSEVHVFKGEVRFSSGRSSQRSLVQGRAAMVRGNGLPQLMAANPQAFKAMFDLQQRSLAAEAMRYDQWRVASERLNEDSSLLMHLDFENLGASDGTLRNLAESGRSAPDAAVIGCQRTQGRWPEKQALEFQSVNDRVRLAVPGSFDSLTLSVWVRIKGLDRQFNSLFMCDGFESATVHWLIRNDGVLGLTVIGPGSGSFQIVPALRCSRWISSACGRIWL